MTLMQGNRDQILGCMFGGALGDALGYPVEFLDEADLFATYGPEGIKELELDKDSGKALISDDTQMTLFTANGLLSGESAGKMKKKSLEAEKCCCSSVLGLACYTKICISWYSS